MADDARARQALWRVRKPVEAIGRTGLWRRRSRALGRLVPKPYNEEVRRGLSGRWPAPRWSVELDPWQLAPKWSGSAGPKHGACRQTCPDAGHAGHPRG